MKRVVYFNMVLIYHTILLNLAPSHQSPQRAARAESLQMTPPIRLLESQQQIMNSMKLVIPLHLIS